MLEVETAIPTMPVRAQRPTIEKVMRGYPLFGRAPARRFARTPPFGASASTPVSTTGSARASPLEMSPMEPG
ncbi:MAG TPA: hypothetical protein VEK12_15185, partial [Alphaproteobacteria bacterium]|nr:hypothetical protein [Alphaproteobacteria bacterium]